MLGYIEVYRNYLLSSNWGPSHAVAGEQILESRGQLTDHQIMIMPCLTVFGEKKIRWILLG